MMTFESLLRASSAYAANKDRYRIPQLSSYRFRVERAVEEWHNGRKVKPPSDVM